MTWQDARKLLCIRLDTLGDVLMTGPAMEALKRSLPGASVTLLTSRSGAAITPMMPQVDGVIVYEAPWMKATAPRASGAPDLEIAAALAQQRFDAAVIFTVYSQKPAARRFSLPLGRYSAAPRALPGEPVSTADAIGRRRPSPSAGCATRCAASWTL